MMMRKTISFSSLQYSNKSVPVQAFAIVTQCRERSDPYDRDLSVSRGRGARGVAKGRSGDPRRNKSEEMALTKSAGGLLTSPMQGRGSSTHRVCVSVCYRSSGRCGYLTSETKVSKEALDVRN